MKKIYTLLIVTFLIGVVSESYGQYILRPPTIRFDRASQKGNILYVANSIINTGAAAQTTENPPAGTSNNNGFLANYIDIDGDATTFSSSSANLNLASCTQVLFAGLYWGAGRGGISGAPPAGSTNDTCSYNYTLRLYVFCQCYSNGNGTCQPQWYLYLSQYGRPGCCR